MYIRSIEQEIKARLFCGKILFVVGPRQAGKTTLITAILKSLNKKVQTFNCDDPNDRELLSNQSLNNLIRFVGSNDIVFIDEGQKVETIGQTLKLLVDYFKTNKQIFVTGSSSFNLLNSISETLTGRKRIYNLYPISFEEIVTTKEYKNAINQLDELLLYGSYPEVLNVRSHKEKIEVLTELYSSSLFKDINEFRLLKNPAILSQLVKALALQIGSEVSYTELSSLLGIDKNTVESYIDLLEKNYIVFRLPPYFKRKRREISKLRKIYFYDVGVRNMAINQFSLFTSRKDLGAVFENFVISERLKYNSYHSKHIMSYFWRTYDGAEVDLVEESEGKIAGYEIKYTSDKKRKSGSLRWQEECANYYTIKK